MTDSEKSQPVCDHFGRRYDLEQSDLFKEIERSVCGCDYGASSWTTLDEIDRIVDLLAMGPHQTILEIGTGTGWPGLLLARKIGCQIQLTDLPLEGLQIARDRAVSDDMVGQVGIVVASGHQLPVTEASYDRIFHSDVLCCLPEKIEVLNECRRCVTEQGSMVFPVIFIAPGLSKKDYALAVEGGPPFIESAFSYPEMLAQSAWRITHQIDITNDYVSAIKALEDKLELHQDEMRNVLGDEVMNEQLISRAARLKAATSGVLHRELFRVVPVPAS